MLCASPVMAALLGLRFWGHVPLAGAPCGL
jgi:hypothetical protein